MSNQYLSHQAKTKKTIHLHPWSLGVEHPSQISPLAVAYWAQPFRLIVCFVVRGESPGCRLFGTADPSTAGGAVRKGGAEIL
jgi:hypothetical protein